MIMRPPILWNLLMKMREKSTPGVVGGILCRTVYIDDLLINAIKEGLKRIPHPSLILAESKIYNCGRFWPDRQHFAPWWHRG